MATSPNYIRFTHLISSEIIAVNQTLTAAMDYDINQMIKYFYKSMTNSVLKIFKALSDPTRINIAKKLLTRKELSCQELMSHFPLSQPALSHHFNKLIDAEILTVRKDGTNHYYAVNKDYLDKLGIDIQKIIKL